MNFDLTNTPEQEDPLLSFRFVVYFLGGVGQAHHLLDFRFSLVSGIGVRLDLGNDGEKTYENLVLERGMPVTSSLRHEILAGLNDGEMVARNVLVSILDEGAQPAISWLFEQAFPVSWFISPLDASSPEVIIERIELAYRSFRPFSH